MLASLTRSWSRNLAALTAALLVACSPATTPPAYDLVLRGGTIYDGSGEPGFVGDIAINGDELAAIGDLGEATASREIDVAGLAVAPGREALAERLRAADLPVAPFEALLGQARMQAERTPSGRGRPPVGTVEDRHGAVTGAF